MSKSTPQPDPEDAHKDLLATLAASRELGPEMDKALAESYMQKHQAVTPQNQQVDLPSRFNSSDLASAIVMVAGIAAFVTLFIVKGSEAFGFLWIFFLFGGWRFFRWNRRNTEYYQRRAEFREAHREMREDFRAMRRGYYRIADPSRPALPTPPEPVRPPVSAPPAPPVSTPPLAQAPQPPAAAPLPPVAPTYQPPSTPSGSSPVPPVNPAG